MTFLASFVKLKLEKCVYTSWRKVITSIVLVSIMKLGDSQPNYMQSAVGKKVAAGPLLSTPTSETNQ